MSKVRSKIGGTLTVLILYTHYTHGGVLRVYDMGALRVPQV